MPLDPSIPLSVRPMAPQEGPLESYGRVLQLKNLAQAGQMQDLQMQEHRMGLEQKQREMADQQVAQQVISKYGGDVQKALPELAKSISLPSYQAIAKSHLETRGKLAEIGDKELSVQKYQDDQSDALTAQALALPDDQYAAQWPQIRARALQINPKLQLPDQPIPKAELAQHGLMFKTMKAYTDAEIQRRAAAVERDRAAKAPFDLQVAQNNAITGAPNPAGLTPEQQVMADQRKADALQRDKPVPGRDIPLPADVEAQRVRMRPVAQSGADTGVLSDDDYKRAGAEYAITGLMPALGNGSGPVKQRLIHEKNEFARNSGLTPRDMALAGAAFKGDSKSLATFQTQRDQIVSFEQTAQKNLDLFLSAAKDIPDTGVPWINLPMRQVTEKMTGSAAMAAVNAARQVANNEIAKVTSGGSMGGVLSDSARHEVESYNPKDATFKQTLAVAKILKQDMANRHQSMDDTLGTIRGRIGTFGNAPVVEPSGGKVMVTDPRGVKHTFPNQAAADAFKQAAHIQ